MRLPRDQAPALNRRLARRDDSGLPSYSRFIVAFVGVVLLACIILLIIIILRRARRLYTNPKYIPTKYLKNKWRNWQPGASRYGRVSTGMNGADRSTNTAYNAGAHVQSAGVDRHTSIRSVMTLPAYSQDPKATEQVIGREGERAGMDVVIEFPETVDEEENRREEQMESLYQIRLARRNENAEREARRQRRRELRAAGDWAGLDQMRRESRARADEAASLANIMNTSAATLIAEHQSRERERRVSAVSYADVGHVRHDGSRLRANSAESDNLPLLDSAASMGDARSSRVSLGSFVPPPSLLHRREHSTGSMLSVVTTWSDFSHPEQRTGRSSQEMLASGGLRPDSRRASDVSGARTSPPLQDPDEMANDAEGDIGGSRIPLSVEPPRYDDDDDHSGWEEEAPAYTSPAAGERPSTWAVDTRPSTTSATTSTPTRNSTIGLTRLPSIRPLPAISLDSATPTSPIRMNAVAEHETR